VLCTSNIRDFPIEVVESLGVEVLTPDQLLSWLVIEYEPQMLAAHRTAVASLKGSHRRIDRQRTTKSRCPGDRRPDRRTHRAPVKTRMGLEDGMSDNDAESLRIGCA